MQTIRILVIGFVFLLTVGAHGGDGFDQFLKSANEKVRAKDYAGARAVCDQALENRDLTAEQRFQLLYCKAGSHEREKQYDLARAVYREISSDPDANKAWKLKVGSRIASTHERERNYLDERKELRALLALDGLSSAEKVGLHCKLAVNASRLAEPDQALRECQTAWALPEIAVRHRCQIAQYAGRSGQPEAALQWLREILAQPDLAKREKLSALRESANLLARAGNSRELKETAEMLLRLDDKGHYSRGALMSLARLPQWATTPECTVFAWKSYLSQSRIGAADRIGAYTGLIEAYLRLKEHGDAKQVAATAAADQALGAPTRFRYAVVEAGLKAIEGKRAIATGELDQMAGKLGLSPPEKLEALNAAGKILMVSRNYDAVREIIAMTDKLFRKVEKKLVCRYVENAPLGAGGWFGSEFLKNKDYRVDDFLDYAQKDADLLLYDVSAERGFDADKAKSKAHYFANTAFYMLYDQHGWHIFVVCGEREPKKVLLDGGRTSSLEMYFAPGAEKAYQQWILSQGDGKVRIFDWDSNHRHFRSVRDYMKTETIVSGGNWGTYIFFPWEALYDQLPFDTGDDWLFECIRWSPVGGLSWGGGRVHETGKWGTIKWQPPTAEQLLKIKSNLVRKAWTKYRKSRDAAVWHWRDSKLGDREFYDQCLAPEIERLNKLGEAMKDPAKLSGPQIKQIFAEAVPDWMEFGRLIEEHRTEYLTRKLFANMAE